MATEIVQQKVRKKAAYKGIKQKEWEGFIRRRREKGFMGAAKAFLDSRATQRRLLLYASGSSSHPTSKFWSFPIPGIQFTPFPT